MKMWRNNLFLLFLSVITLSFLYQIAYAHDEAPRVPADKLPIVTTMKNPVPIDEKSIAAGKALYFGTGACAGCHGELGKGDSTIGSRNFVDVAWQSVRTDGELFWAITEGTELGMIPFGDNLSAEDRWELVNYIRSLGKPVTTTANYEK